MIDGSDAMRMCSKYNTKMKLSRCTNHNAANVIVEDKDGKEYQVIIFNDVLKMIVLLDKVLVSVTCQINCYYSTLLSFVITHKNIVSLFSILWLLYNIVYISMH